MPSRRIAEHEFSIEAEQAGQRLDLVLSRGWPQISRSVWQSRIEKKEVLLNGLPAKAARKLNLGDRVLFRFERKEEPAVRSDYHFLYGIEPEDRIIAISKPPDLPVHPSGIYFQNTLTEILKKTQGPDFPVFLINRIDRETSGIVLLARDKEMAALMQGVLQTSARKEYIVFVEGSFPEYLDAEGWIGLYPEASVRKQMYFTKERAVLGGSAKTCRTEFRKLAEQTKKDGASISAVRALLHTGRTHQIRATLYSLGFPVVGDRLYGVDPEMYLRMIRDEETEEDRKRLRISRSALHSWRLVFRHPSSGKQIEIRAPLPGDLAGLVPGLADTLNVLAEKEAPP